MEGTRTPSPDHHRRWVDELVATPDSPDSGGVPLQTSDTSYAEHVLRGSKSFTVRSFRSRTYASSLRIPSSTENVVSNSQSATRQSAGHVTDASQASASGEVSLITQSFRAGPYKPRPSPTPSLKRKKVDAIIRAHGSPTHIRVTAGGRIVPSEQSPLCYPRYGYSAVKVCLQPIPSSVMS